jgi:hypothetical protein
LSPISMMAEGVGFEPTRDFHPCRFSRPVYSTTLSPLREGRIIPEIRNNQNLAADSFAAVASDFQVYKGRT